MFESLTYTIYDVTSILEELTSDPFFWVFVVITMFLLFLNGYWFLIKEKR